MKKKDEKCLIGKYQKPFSVSIDREYGEPSTMPDVKSLFPVVGKTTITINLIGLTVDSEYLSSAFEHTAKMLGVKMGDEPPKPEKVILNDPATIVLWSDGTKTVTKCKGCDEYEPLFGVLACAMRKVGRNKVSIDAWEGVLAFLADSLADADECRVLADALNATADALDCGDTMDAIVCHEMRGGEDEGEELPQEPLPLVDDGSPDERHERTRSLLRELLDRGEL